MITEKPPVRYNNLWLGIAIGLLFPIFCFFIYWLFVHSNLGFPRNLIRYLLAIESLGDIVILCTIGNLVVFYLSLKRARMSKGIIIGTLAYVALIFYLMFFVETTA